MAKEFQIRKGVLIKYKGSSAEVTISDDLGVTSIGEQAFKECDSLEKVIFQGYKVREIGLGAFQYCERLKSVKWPQELKMIEPYAFYRTSLDELILPDTVEEIGNGAFGNMYNLRSVYIPSAVRRIEHNIFLNCEHLENVSLPYLLESVNGFAFMTLPALKSLQIRKYGGSVTIPLERKLDDAYWQELKQRADAEFMLRVTGGGISAAPDRAQDTLPVESPPPQTDPLERRVAALETELSRLDSELSTLRKLVISQQAQIAALMKRRERRRITSFHPLTEEELRRL